MTFQRLHLSAYPPVGRWLKARRDVLGYTLAQASDRVQMSEVTLRLLETERFQALAEPVFVRGYLRRYAQALQLNPQEVITLFDAWLQVHESQGGRFADACKQQSRRVHRQTLPWLSNLSAFSGRMLHSQAGQVAAVALCLGLFSFFLSHGTGNPERVAINAPKAASAPVRADATSKTAIITSVSVGNEHARTVAPITPLNSWLIASETTHVQVTDKHGLIVFSGLVRAGTPVMLKGSKPFDIRAAREGTVSLVNDRLARYPERGVAVL